ncbi:hypothetical protein BJX61DRAFT_542239 [Aspergillus egyptiacus]|nr:hypothetical protein BJX61DRAFT_542239 [Aspergillus egyptiacus]
MSKDHRRHQHHTPHWDPPYIVKPKAPQHTQTLILLHDNGSTGHDFAKAFFKRFPSLHTHYPTLRFVFPTARRTNGKLLLRREVTTHWFDLHDDRDTSRSELADCNEYLKALLRDEALMLLNDARTSTGNYGYDRLILGGEGVGGTVAMCHLVSSCQARLAGFVAMDAYLHCYKRFDPGWLGWLGWENNQEEGEESEEESDGDRLLYNFNVVRDEVGLKRLHREHLRPVPKPGARDLRPCFPQLRTPVLVSKRRFPEVPESHWEVVLDRCFGMAMEFDQLEGDVEEEAGIAFRFFWSCGIPFERDPVAFSSRRASVLSFLSKE